MSENLDIGYVGYEILTKNIFEKLVNQDVVRTIDIKHNVTLKGKTTNHQIDVYWEFEIGETKYKTVVQCKDWNSTVDQGELIKFNGVLEDLPDQPRGIFVTRTGYQRGAKKYADAQGIILYELREPTDEDWEGRVQSIHIDLNFYIPNFEDVNLNYDGEWVKSEKRRLDIPENTEFNVSINGETILYDEDDQEKKTIAEIINSLTPVNKELAPSKKILEFDQPFFIHTGNINFPKLKINALNAIISVKKREELILIEAKPIVGFILSNVLKDEEILFDNEIKPLHID